MFHAKWHLVVVAALALAVAPAMLVALRVRALEERLLASLLPLLIYLIVATAAVEIAAAGVDVTWTNARLVPSVAFAKGLDVYSTATSGSVQTTLYPPGWVLAYLPTALGSTPTAVIVIGHGLSHAFALLPALAFFGCVSRSFPITVLAVAAFEFLLLRTGPLRTVYVPHADSPALGFGLTALLFFWLALKRSPRARAWLVFLATGMAWLALWTKQVMAALLPLMALWVLASRGVGPLLRFCGWAAVSGLVVALPLLALFPVEGVVFDTIWLVARCPWVGQVPWNLLAATEELTRECVPLLLLLALGASVVHALAPGARGERAPDAWRVVAVAALFLAPTSVLGRVKVGGWPNTLSPTLYALAAAVCLMLPCAWRRASAAADLLRLRSLRRFAVLLAVTIGFAWSLALSTELTTRRFSIRNNAAQQAFDYLLHEDPHAYFPVHPLSHLMAQGVLYHYAAAVHDREVLGGYLMSRRQRRRHFPAKPSIVCWKEPAWGNEYVRSTYFAAYSAPVAVPELPAFRCRGLVHPDAGR